MAKPTKNASLICTVLTIISLVGLFLGFLTNNPFFIIALLLPAIVYEIYRTEGNSTRWSSSLLLVVLLLEAFIIYSKTSLNLSQFVDLTNPEAKKYLQTFGDVKIIALVVMGILALILFKNTFGFYTKWLAGIIIVAAVSLIYILDKQVFNLIINYLVSLFQIGRVGFGGEPPY